MTRTEFMDHFERYLANALQRDSVRRETDNNVQATFWDDVHIGVVTRESNPAEVRCHIWTQDGARRARWKANPTISVPTPPGSTLKFRDGPKGPGQSLTWSLTGPTTACRTMSRLRAS